MERSDFRILVVDDEEDWVTVNSKVLSRRGYHVEGASDALEAVELVRERPCHLAFLDIDMPGMSGIELIDRLRAHAPDIEIVMLTGYGTEEKHSAARIRGILDFLEKIVCSEDRVLGEEMADLAEEVFEKVNSESSKT